MSEDSECEWWPEFNTGFVTALTLFYGHSMNPSIRSRDSAHLVLYVATDHLADIEYPDNISPELREKVETFVDWVFTHRISWDIEIDTVHEVFKACREILTQIDEEVFGLEVIVKHG